MSDENMKSIIEFFSTKPVDMLKSNVLIKIFNEIVTERNFNMFNLNHMHTVLFSKYDSNSSTKNELTNDYIQVFFNFFNVEQYSDVEYLSFFKNHNYLCLYVLILKYVYTKKRVHGGNFDEYFRILNDNLMSVIPVDCTRNIDLKKKSLTSIFPYSDNDHYPDNRDTVLDDVLKKSSFYQMYFLILIVSLVTMKTILGETTYNFPETVQDYFASGSANYVQSYSILATFVTIITDQITIKDGDNTTTTFHEKVQQYINIPSTHHDESKFTDIFCYDFFSNMAPILFNYFCGYPIYNGQSLMMTTDPVFNDITKIDEDAIRFVDTYFKTIYKSWNNETEVKMFESDERHNCLHFKDKLIIYANSNPTLDLLQNSDSHVVGDSLKRSFSTIMVEPIFVNFMENKDTIISFLNKWKDAFSVEDNSTVNFLEQVILPTAKTEFSQNKKNGLVSLGQIKILLLGNNDKINNYFKEKVKPYLISIQDRMKKFKFLTCIQIFLVLVAVGFVMFEQIKKTSLLNFGWLSFLIFGVLSCEIISHLQVCRISENISKIRNFILDTQFLHNANRFVSLFATGVVFFMCVLLLMFIFSLLLLMSRKKVKRTKSTKVSYQYTRTEQYLIFVFMMATILSACIKLYTVYRVYFTPWKELQ